MRIGLGFDVHRLVEGRRLVLGGVEIPSPVGLDGHSDADVILHAVMDAVLGALALGDIGHYFPNTDPRFKDADSIQLAEEVALAMRGQGYRIGNMDIMVMAEWPKIAPHVSKMQARIAGAFQCSERDVGIKATTMEQLGFVGRREGITAQAVVLLLPSHGRD
ncbi:2-C-methyl-D-erythritol 2,4-cyclodiphosphate synthase [Alicyclobacillus ferrooxydans]|uniref:2-C-methyl-D-erythritol 2,4-cyclodiphosphate synthase n=1 Tax=Alicyclobacillus ferrooxydans TaxID=471514 RepID=A0A0N8PPF4_9BACL|nr:2-C-methyl-D-erythritol 2,4-cyclodiphosphate synthase [Alicyclobacillus ferrooxydans]KPV44173.1 hypothetical protein AN477_08900 [Alicyclobacillus ferrooxydans]